MSDNATPARPPRKPRVQRVLEVVRTEQLTPHLVRVHLGGAGFAAFLAETEPERLAQTDKYVKILFAKPELGLEPPYDLDALRGTLSLDDMPVTRTYTVRDVDAEAGTIAVDFVVHGDEGIAGPWAATASIGDKVAFMGPGGQFRPSDGDVEHLFFGDDSAIPAIHAAIEVLPATARGLALIEVDSAQDEIAITAPAGVEVRWLHRRAADGTTAEYGTVLVDAVAALPVPTAAAGAEVFAHGEREAMKQLRRILQAGWGIDRRALSLSAYWARGRTEDRFQAEKREPVGQIFED